MSLRGGGGTLGFTLRIPFGKIGVHLRGIFSGNPSPWTTPGTLKKPINGGLGPGPGGASEACWLVVTLLRFGFFVSETLVKKKNKITPPPL